MAEICRRGSAGASSGSGGSAARSAPRLKRSQAAATMPRRRIEDSALTGARRLGPTRFREKFPVGGGQLHGLRGEGKFDSFFFKTFLDLEIDRLLGVHILVEVGRQVEVHRFD